MDNHDEEKRKTCWYETIHQKLVKAYKILNND